MSCGLDYSFFYLLLSFILFVFCFLFFSSEEKEDKTKPWLKFNSYWDETTIDKQWLKSRQMERKKQFVK